MYRLTLRTVNRKDASNTARWRTLGLGLVLATLAITPLMAQVSSDWPMFGANVANTASNAAETGISVATAPALKMAWSFTTGGDVSARAAIVNGVAYFPDWAGNLWAVNTVTGKAIWSHQLSDYGLAAGTVSRTSPAVANGLVYIGTQFNPASAPRTGWLLAINAATGTLAWKIQPDTSNPFPVITASPVVAGGVVYFGMTSNEERAATDPTYPCCSSRGSVIAVGASTGAVLWQTFTVPNGYSGGNVWGSNAVVDSARGTVFVGTGNNSSIPNDPAYTACVSAGGTRATCQSSNNHADSIIALDMHTGAIKWATRLETWGQNQFGVADGSDFWNVACAGVLGSPVNCPPSPGPDYDFGSSPNEITYQSGATTKTIIGAGQKSGIYYALDPDTGAELWHTQVGPGSILGGMEWGSASDGTRIYVAIANLFGIPYAAGSAGSWAALDPATGAILWQKADPNGSIDLGPMAVANGVVYAPSMAAASLSSPSSPPTAPTMFALDASNGNTLWSFAAGSSVIAGASIVDGAAYWGSGYAHLGTPGFTGNNKFYAFAVAASALNGSNCNGTYTGTYNGNLTVSAGQSCTFTNGGINGSLTQTGGAMVLANNSFVSSNVQITGGGTFSIGPSVSVGGDLQIQNLPLSAGTNQVCGASIKGNFTFHNNGTAVLFGSTECAGNTVGGDLQVMNNTAATTIDNNTVSGTLTDQGNTAPTQVFNNGATKNLQCSGNSSITGGGNTASSKQGQCAAF